MIKKNRDNNENLSKEELVDLLETISSQIHNAATNCRDSRQINFLIGKNRLKNAIIKLSQSYGLLCSLVDDLKAIKELYTKKPVEEDMTLYCCSSELIYRIREEMILRRSDRLEDLCFVAGIRIPSININNIIVPITILNPTMEHRRTASARADPLSVYRNLKYVDIFNLLLVFLCHCHPGKGPRAIRESSQDKETYSAWERDYPLIGVIFDEDGRYFRFFTATNKRFKIEIIGGGVKHVKGNTYCFSE